MKRERASLRIILLAKSQIGIERAFMLSLSSLLKGAGELKA